MPDREPADTTAGAPDEAPSKSARKRRMTALQQLGESLAALSDRQLENIPELDERLLQTIAELRRIRSNSARRRHLQYIGKLMRDIDPEPIALALQALQDRRRERNEAFHELEAVRDEVLAEGLAGLEKIVGRWPQADRQHLRQLLRQHQRELQDGRAPAASRKLFKYLRTLQAQDRDE